MDINYKIIIIGKIILGNSYNLLSIFRLKDKII